MSYLLLFRIEYQNPTKFQKIRIFLLRHTSYSSESPNIAHKIYLFLLLNYII